MAPSFTSRPSYTRQSTFPGTQSFSQQSPFPGDHSHIPTRQSTFPGYYNLSRHKPRRWPLVLRVSKGSVHFDILLPVLLHSAFTSLIVYLDMYWRTLGLPGTIIPSLSIVVGLMLVFRNGTSYDRFWAGRNCLASIITGVRNLTRYFLVCDRSLKTDEATDDQRQDTESVVRLLVAMLHAVKHHLRAEFATSACPSAPPTPYLTRSGTATPISSLHNSQFVGPNTPLLAQSMASTLRATYTDLLPSTLPSLESRGVALPLQLSLSVEAYIRRGVQRDWWIAPQAAMLSSTLNSLLADFAKMETIRTTPMPLAHLVHTRQVLALYLMILPFAMVDEMVWWAVPITAVVAFTLYGIEGIGRQLEDPFGYDRNDIKMDAIVLDAQQEVVALLEEWRCKGVGFQ